MRVVSEIIFLLFAHREVHGVVVCVHIGGASHFADFKASWPVVLRAHPEVGQFAHSFY